MTRQTTDSTLVLQAARPEPPAAIRRCLRSVETWASARGHDYRLLDDALFDPLPDWARKKFGDHRVVLSDLARLLWIRRLLGEGWDRVLWLDSDVFVFAPADFDLPPGEALSGGCAFGREIWVQPDGGTGLSVHRSVHNAACLFHRDNAVLDFYIHASGRILARHDAARGIAPQILGPKFLTAQHNIVGFTLMHSVGMASPLVLSGLAGQGGAGASALTRMRDAQEGPMQAVNLCLNYLGRTVDGVQVDEALFTAAMDRLSASPGIFAG